MLNARLACVFLLQLRPNLVKWLVFHLCLWRKSYFMKRGVKHDKVRPPGSASTAAAHVLQENWGFGDTQVVLLLACMRFVTCCCSFHLVKPTPAHSPHPCQAPCAHPAYL
jgi:hypothetical protein